MAASPEGYCIFKVQRSCLMALAFAFRGGVIVALVYTPFKIFDA
jgi:hypothetical protein